MGEGLFELPIDSESLQGRGFAARAALGLGSGVGSAVSQFAVDSWAGVQALRNRSACSVGESGGAV